MFYSLVILSTHTKRDVLLDIIHHPVDPTARGCQLSILMKKDGKKVFKRLEKEGVITDWREPDVIRVAPVPLYNTFEEVYQFTEIFKRALL